MLILRGAGDQDDMAQGFIANGAKLVLITEGAKGASAYTPQSKVFAPAKQVSVVDTVGAGDSFLATLINELFLKQNS